MREVVPTRCCQAWATAAAGCISVPFQRMQTDCQPLWVLIWTQDPFRGGDNIIVMADAYEPPRDKDGKHVDMKAIPTNTRCACAEAMKKVAAEEPWFGIEQVRAKPC